MEPRLKLSKLSSAPVVDATFYRSIVGSLRYLVNSRTDLAFSVGYVRVHGESNNRAPAGCEEGVEICSRAQNYGCHYQRKKDAQLTGFSDSDLARVPLEFSSSSAETQAPGNLRSKR
jgi:hypothetical protein